MARILVGDLGSIEAVDDGFCALVGYAREELLGSHGADLIPVGERPVVAAAMDQARMGDLRPRSTHLKRRDGSLVEVDVDARPLVNGWLEMSVRPRSELEPPAPESRT